MGGLAQIEHGRSIDLGSAAAGKNIGRFQKDGSACFPGHSTPFLPGLAGGPYGIEYFVAAGFVVCRQNMAVIVGHNGLSSVAGLDSLAPDDDGDLDLLG
jgi:hypothetical protein